ncbi:MAG: GatB/YqeY domain-containing protein [Bacillota bacterium]
MSENKMAEKLFMDQKEAMKSKNRFYLSVIRMLRAELQNAEIAKNAPLNDQEELAILAREVKRRKEALGDYVRSGRQDLVTDLKREIEILSKYLPEQLSEDMLVRMVKEAIIESGANSKQEMGKVMSLLMPRVKGKADGSLVRELVDKNLQ